MQFELQKKLRFHLSHNVKLTFCDVETIPKQLPLRTLREDILTTVALGKFFKL